MEMTPGLATVVIPVYRGERYIRQALTSALGQTFGPLEVIVVDDGSPDASAAICEGVGDPRVRVLRQEHKGLSAARNAGVSAAHGEMVAFLDSDDVWLPQMLARHAAHLAERPEIGLSYSACAYVGADGKRLGLEQRPRLHEVTPAHVLYQNPIKNGSASVIRRAAFEAVRLPDTDGTARYFDEGLTHAADLECWLRLVLRTSWRLEGVPDVLVLYRVHPGAHSGKLESYARAWELVLERTRAYAPEFVATWERKARASLQRYLAQRALLVGPDREALGLITRSLRQDPGLLLAQPLRTLLTASAAVLSATLPPNVASVLRRVGFSAAGFAQRSGLLRD
jgi:glycosyltransferase involved in cell wall biosynthesis